MNFIFFLIDIAWDIFWGLAKLAVLVFVSGAISYSLWWLFFESAAGPYLIGAVVIAIILRIVGASTE